MLNVNCLATDPAVGKLLGGVPAPENGLAGWISQGAGWAVTGDLAGVFSSPSIAAKGERAMVGHSAHVYKIFCPSTRTCTLRSLAKPFAVDAPFVNRLKNSKDACRFSVWWCHFRRWKRYVESFSLSCAVYAAIVAVRAVHALPPPYREVQTITREQGANEPFSIGIIGTNYA